MLMLGKEPQSGCHRTCLCFGISRKPASIPLTPTPPLCFCNVLLPAKQLGESPARIPAKGPGILQRVLASCARCQGEPCLPAPRVTLTRDSQRAQPMGHPQTAQAAAATPSGSSQAR